VVEPKPRCTAMIRSLGALFPAWRYHAVFTDSPLPTLEAEAAHRRHAIVEQVIADLKNGPIAHLPSVLCRELGAAGASRDRVQPHPRRRLSGSALHAKAATGPPIAD
jgi:hypothetical protein